MSICTLRTSPNNLQVIKRASQRVWASPSHRRMDCNKSESEEITFPFVCFPVDNHEDAWSDVIVRLENNRTYYQNFPQYDTLV